MASDGPLNITLSIGDVSFHLTPSSPPSNDPSTPSLVSTPPHSRRVSTYAVHRQRRRNGLERANGVANLGQQPQLHGTSSPPIIAIHHGSPQMGSYHGMSTNHQFPSVTSPKSPQSPLQQHIKGRVRALKDKIEFHADNSSRRRSALGTAATTPPFSQQPQSPLFASANTNEYSVDLNSFTGTLHISSLKNLAEQHPHQSMIQNNSPPGLFQNTNRNSMAQSMQTTMKNINIKSPKMLSHSSPTVLFSPRKRTYSNHHHHQQQPDDENDTRDSIELSKKRSKRRSTWIVSNENEVEMGVKNVDEQRSDCESMSDEDERATTSSGRDSRKSVRFSVLREDSVINPSFDEEENQGPNSEENKASSSSLNSNGITDLYMEQALKMKMKKDDPGFIPMPTIQSVSMSSSNEENNEPNSMQLVPQARIGIEPSPTSFRSPLHSIQQQQQRQPLKGKSKHFFSSPPGTAATTFASPPRAVMANAAKSSLNIARGTSQVLSRSGKHVMKQITLAGKDAYDALQGENTSAIYAKHFNASSNTSNDNTQGGRSGRSRTAFLNNLTGDIDDEDELYDAFDGTELHYACASDSLAHIRCLLEYDTVDDLHKVDCGGKLPIHVLTENHRLINDDPLGCEEVAFTMIELMGPEKAIHALHPCGLAPFVYVIGSWTRKLHRGALARNVSSAILNGCVIKPSSEPLAAQLEDDEHQQSLAPAEKSRRRVTYRSLFNSSTVANDKKLVSSADRAKLLYVPRAVTISDHVRWAIRILSRLIDEYPEQTREAILTNIASVPLFLKSLLLIGDADDMAELLDMSLVKHAIVDKRSINVWLCAMLTDEKEVKMRAVTFMKASSLHLLSRMTLHDLAATSLNPNRYCDAEIERFKHLREDTFNAVYVMDGIVPAILELGSSMVENISTTHVLMYITDRTIRKEKVFFVLICDFFYAIFLLMGYRLNVEFVLNYQTLDGPEHYREHSYISTSTMGIAMYFLVKEFMTLISLSLTSKKLAKRYCTSVFNIIDVAAVLMLLGSESALNIDPNFLDSEGFAASFTIILLWLKVMGEYKVLNSAFSLFLYAVNEVVKEVKWFLIFLMSVTFMFSDAARAVVAARGDCQHQVDGDYIVEDFCSDNLLDGIIRMYSVLVGDVALEYFQSSDAMVAVFVFFSFFSIIILLNILVAIIIDSYEGSKQRSREIFYGARVEYAAHLVARQQFLSPRERSDFHVATYVPQTLRQVMRLVFVLANIVAFLSFQYGFFGTVYFLTLDQKDDFRMIRSLIITYVTIGAVFNAYMISVAAIALFSRYDKRYNANWLAGHRHTGHTILHNAVEKMIQFLEITVKLFHGLLGFNADRSVDQGINDLQDDFLIGEEKM